MALHEWFRRAYEAAAGFDRVDGGRAFRAFAASHREAPPGRTGILRQTEFVQLRYAYPLSSEGYDAAPAVAAFGDSRTIVGFAWWRRGSAAADPEYVCAAPTFMSRDGEYRSGFVPYAAFARAVEEAPAVIAPIEAALQRLIRSGALRLALLAPEGREAPRLALELAAAALSNEGWRAAAGLLPAHSAEGFGRLCAAVAAVAPGLLDARPEVMKARGAFRRRTRAFTGVDTGTSLVCGQKLAPLTLRELARPFDPAFAAWRELLAAGVASDLVLNRISPSFPFVNQWCYAEGAAAPELFENAAMGDRFRRSDLAEGAAAKVREGRALLAPAGAAGAVGDFSARLYDAIHHAQSYLIQSGVARLLTMEDVGLTLGAFGTAIRRAASPYVDDLQLFATPAAAARVLFELVYGAHCLHAVGGVVHGDIHANNIALAAGGNAGFAAEPGGAARPLTEGGVVAYALSDEERDVFVFPHGGITACLIDFSRAFVVGGEAARRVEARLGGYRLPPLQRDQADRALRALHRHAPELVAASAGAIRAALWSDPGLVHEALAAADVAAIGAAVAGALEAELAAKLTPPDQRRLPICGEAIALARRVAEEGRRELADRLSRLGEPPGERAFPGAAVLARLFDAYRFPALPDPRALRLLDAWSATNPPRWSGEAYARFPPWARLDEIEKRYPPGDVGRDIIGRSPADFLAALRPYAAPRRAANRVLAELDSADAPPPAGESWLDA